MNESMNVPAQVEPEKKSSHAKRVFVWALEIVAVAVSYFQSSAIVRFISAKLSMDVIVEVTGTFGKEAGHNLSTFLSAIVAEPRLVAVILAAIILVIDLIVWIVGSTVRTARRRRQRREAINSDYRYLSYGTGEAARKYSTQTPSYERTDTARTFGEYSSAKPADNVIPEAYSGTNPSAKPADNVIPETYSGTNPSARPATGYVSSGSSAGYVSGGYASAAARPSVSGQTGRAGGTFSQAQGTSRRNPAPSGQSAYVHSRQNTYPPSGQNIYAHAGQIDPYDVSYLSDQAQPPVPETSSDPYDVSYLKNPQDKTPLE